MKSFTIKQVTIGSGIPKICVPIVAHTKDELLEQLSDFDRPETDLLEWRIDYMDCLTNTSELVNIANTIQARLPKKPLLVTFRSKREGGEQELSSEDYFALLRTLAKYKVADLLDVELFATDDVAFLKNFVQEVQSYGCKVILSNHDFSKTPAKEEILSRLTAMQDLGADVAKIAVMPNSAEDVLALLSATREMSEEIAEIPIVTMSMGKLGAISRICGQTFGSAITFGSLKKASAPGQIEISELSNLLQTLQY